MKNIALQTLAVVGSIFALTACGDNADMITGQSGHEPGSSAGASGSGSGKAGSTGASAGSNAAGSSGSSGKGGSSANGNAGSNGTSGSTGTTAGQGGGKNPPVCIPGVQVACACPGTTVTGAQDCKSDGSGYGQCFGCPTVGAAGASGSGGTSSAAGAAGKGGSNAAGSGGSSVAGAGGNSGVGGAAGSSGVGGSAGSSGTGASSGSGGAAGNGGAGGMAQQKLLISFDGPPAGIAWTGVVQQIMFNVKLLPLVNDLEVKKMQFALECDGGGMIKGSKGTPYFTSVEIKSPQGVYAGPLELPANLANGATSIDLVFTDSFTISASATTELSLMAYIPGVEDMPGELLGKSCHVTMKSLAGDSVKDTVTGKFLSANEMNVSTDIVGNSFIPTKTDLTLVMESTPVTNIVVAGKDAWIPFTQYLVSNLTSETQSITQATISQIDANGDTADFSDIALAANGSVWLGSPQVQTGGPTGSWSVSSGLGGPLQIPPQSNMFVQVWAKVAPVQSSLTANGAWHGVPRSGHTPALQLNTVTASSSKGMMVQLATPDKPNSMVIRKSEPVVTKQALSSTTLANIDQDLIKFQVAADSAGSIALKQITFALSKTTQVALSSFRLRRGWTDLDPATYAITADDGTDLMNGTLNAGKVSSYVFVSMKQGQEESISGSGNVYELHATVAGATAGQSVTLEFWRDDQAHIVTGYLVNNVMYGSVVPRPYIYHLDTWTSPSGTPALQGGFGTFVWSDNSEVPHSSNVQTSRDWTNDAYVQDLSQSQTLSLLSLSPRPFFRREECSTHSSPRSDS